MRRKGIEIFTSRCSCTPSARQPRTKFNWMWCLQPSNEIFWALIVSTSSGVCPSCKRELERENKNEKSKEARNTSIECMTSLKWPFCFCLSFFADCLFVAYEYSFILSRRSSVLTCWSYVWRSNVSCKNQKRENQNPFKEKEKKRKECFLHFPPRQTSSTHQA